MAVIEFDRNYYMTKYPDVANVVNRGSYQGDPYNHYLEYGRVEGRFANRKEELAFNQKDKNDDYGVILFDEKNFGGKKIFLPEGKFNILAFGFNDMLSSLKLQKGYAVKLWEHWGMADHYQNNSRRDDGNMIGRNVFIYTDVADLSDKKFDFDNTMTVIEVIKSNGATRTNGQLPKSNNYDTDTPNWFDENFYISQSLELQTWLGFNLLFAGQAYHHWYFTGKQQGLAPNQKNEYPALIMPYLPTGAWNVPKVRQNRLEILDIINKIKWTNKNNGQIGVENFNVPNFYAEETKFDFTGYENLEFSDFEYSVRKRCGDKPDCPIWWSSGRCDNETRPYYNCRNQLEQTIQKIQATSDREKAWFIEKEQALAKLTAEKIIEKLPNVDNTKGPTLKKNNIVPIAVAIGLVGFGGYLWYKNRNE